MTQQSCRRAKPVFRGNAVCTRYALRAKRSENGQSITAKGQVRRGVSFRGLMHFSALDAEDRDKILSPQPDIRAAARTDSPPYKR